MLTPDVIAVVACAAAATGILLLLKPRREPPTMGPDWLERQQRNEERAADRSRDPE